MEFKQLKYLIRYGENNRIEFKQIPCDGLYKTMCAFLNTDGGIIVVGVDDHGDIIGYKPSKRMLEIFHEKTSHWGREWFREEILRVGSRSIWAIIVKPFSKVDIGHSTAQWNGFEYVRIGSSTRKKL